MLRDSDTPGAAHAHTRQPRHTCVRGRESAGLSVPPHPRCCSHSSPLRMGFFPGMLYALSVTLSETSLSLTQHVVKAQEKGWTCCSHMVTLQPSLCPIQADRAWGQSKPGSRAHPLIKNRRDSLGEQEKKKCFTDSLNQHLPDTSCASLIQDSEIQLWTSILEWFQLHHSRLWILNPCKYSKIKKARIWNTSNLKCFRQINSNCNSPKRASPTNSIHFILHFL